MKLLTDDVERANRTCIHVLFRGEGSETGPLVSLHHESALAKGDFLRPFLDINRVDAVEARGTKLAFGKPRGGYHAVV